jgi:hypothetical protein
MTFHPWAKPRLWQTGRGFFLAASVDGLFLDADLLLRTIRDLKAHDHQLKPCHPLMLACFDPYWPDLNIAVANFESGQFRTDLANAPVKADHIPDCGPVPSVGD